MFGKLFKQKDKKDKEKEGYYFGKYSIKAGIATVKLATSTWKLITKKNKEQKDQQHYQSNDQQKDQQKDYSKHKKNRKNSFVQASQVKSQKQRPLFFFHSQVFDKEQRVDQQKYENDELYQLMLCPISQEIMKNPMIVTKCGHNFERKDIQSWLQKHNTCPLCNNAIGKEDLKFNFQLKQIIQVYQKQKQKVKHEQKSHCKKEMIKLQQNEHQDRRKST